MPTYEFACAQCGKPFELDCSIHEYEEMKREGVHCPECHSANVARQVTKFEVQTTSKA
jgi:putative FmdB family regulatory protein